LDEGECLQFVRPEWFGHIAPCCGKTVLLGAKKVSDRFDFFGDRHGQVVGDQPHLVDHRESASPQLHVELAPETFPHGCVNWHPTRTRPILLACGVLILNCRWPVLPLLLADVE
jgi:hypothetical protein